MTAKQIWIKYKRLSDKLEYAVKSKDMEALRSAAFRASYLADYLMKIYFFKDSLYVDDCERNKSIGTQTEDIDDHQTQVSPSSTSDVSSRDILLSKHVSQSTQTDLHDESEKPLVSVSIQELPQSYNVDDEPEDPNELGIVTAESLLTKEQRTTAKKLKARGHPIKIHWIYEYLDQRPTLLKDTLKGHYDAYMSDIDDILSMKFVYYSLRQGRTNDTLSQVWVQSYERDDHRELMHRIWSNVPENRKLRVLKRIKDFLDTTFESLHTGRPLKIPPVYHVLTLLEMDIRFDLKRIYGRRLKSLV